MTPRTPASKSKRKRQVISAETVANVLEKSGRRCCLCFGINHEFTEKDGQIAHLDHDRSNNAEENLAWFCLRHHSLYDSKTSQHRNYTVTEAKRYRTQLHASWNELQRGRDGPSLAYVELVTKGHTHIATSRNILSVSDNGVGDYTVVLDRDFPDDKYTVWPMGTTPKDFDIVEQSPGSFRVKFKADPVYVAFKIEGLSIA